MQLISVGRRDKCCGCYRRLHGCKSRQLREPPPRDVAQGGASAGLEIILRAPCYTEKRWSAASHPDKARLHCFMRLWTLHPRHLDGVGLVALWREALLAQAVLLGRTRGYTRHPQLHRFRAADRAALIADYLRVVADEATSRGYSFNRALIVTESSPIRRVPETKGQLLYEWEHLARKVRRRSPLWHRDHLARAQPTSHPLFRIVAGGVRDWERV